MATKDVAGRPRGGCAPGTARLSCRWLCSGLFWLVLAGWTAPAAAQTGAQAHPHWTESSPVSHEALVLLDTGVSLGANLLGFGLFAASFEIDAANCRATGSTNCGIAGTTVGMTLWAAMQVVVAPLASNLISDWAGAPVDEGWSYGGAAIASLVSLLGGGLAAYVALFPAEGDIHTGIATAVITIGIVHSVINLLVRELSRPAS
ncbi:MAG: hypothetical protein AB8I08_05935 [Sandaracinaceae bacterium]